MRTTTSEPEVVVVGGGLAGCTAAAFVARAGRRVVLHEARSTLGGRAATDHVDGYLMNRGPHALYKGGEAASVLGELGIGVLGHAPPTGGKISFEQVLHRGPFDPLSTLRSDALSLRDKIDLGRLFAKLAKLDPASVAHLSVQQWVESVTDRPRVASVVLASVRLTSYTHMPDLVSADVAVTQLQLGAGQGVEYLDGGWSTLIEALRSVAPIQVVTGEKITTLPEAPVVIVATGDAASTGALVGVDYNVGPAVRTQCLDLGLRQRPAHDFVLGGDEPYYYSNHSAVAALAPADRWHVSVVQYLGPSDTPDTPALRAFLSRIGVQQGDIETERTLKTAQAVSAVAIADFGGLAGRPPIDSPQVDGVFVAGDWVGDRGHLADASMSSGRSAAQAALRYLDKRAAVRIA